MGESSLGTRDMTPPHLPTGQESRFQNSTLKFPLMSLGYRDMSQIESSSTVKYRLLLSINGTNKYLVQASLRYKQQKGYKLVKIRLIFVPN